MARWIGRRRTPGVLGGGWALVVGWVLPGCRGQQARKERIADLIARPGSRTPVQRALLNEQLARYPTDDGHVAPTRLGNAIRRFEEYGHNRFRHCPVHPPAPGPGA